MQERRDANSGMIVFTPGPQELEEKRRNEKLSRMERILELLMDEMGLSEERKQRLRGQATDG